MLEDQKKTQENCFVKKCNFQGRKRKAPNHKLNIETSTTTDHKDLMDVHAALLVGADGGQAHAAAMVDGIVFDSAAANAMPLTCQDALDWRCNCAGGYKKTGGALRIKVANCEFKASRNLQVQEAPDEKPAAADTKEDSSKEESEHPVEAQSNYDLAWGDGERSDDDFVWNHVSDYDLAWGDGERSDDGSAWDCMSGGKEFT